MQILHRFAESIQRYSEELSDPRMAKILKRRGNSIEASRRDAGHNEHLGGAFSTRGQGRGVNFPSPLVVAF